MNTQPAMTNRYEVVPLGIDRYTNLTDFDENEAAENGWPQELISEALRGIGRRERTPNNQLAPTVQPDPAAVRVQLTQAREADADPRANVAGELARLTRELREMTNRYERAAAEILVSDQRIYALAYKCDAARADAGRIYDALLVVREALERRACSVDRDTRVLEVVYPAIDAHAQAK